MRSLVVGSVFMLYLKSFSAARYGVDSEYCVDQTLAEKGKGGIVIWCSEDAECSKGWKCVPSGAFHFSKPINYCCQSRESICSLPPNPGYGDCMAEPQTRFYFNSAELLCKPFKFMNCIGRNQNQFNTHEQCVRFCQSTACKPGEVLLLAVDNKPIACGDQKCPAGHRCVYDSLFRKHVCCGHTPSGVCPIGMVSFASIRSSLPTKCTPSEYRDECPTDYVCTSQGNHNYCCSPEDSVCPFGQRPYMHAVSKNSMKCDPQRPLTCPDKYYCSPAVPGAIWGFCCGLKIESACPNGTQAYRDRLTNNPQRCTVGVSQCSIGFTCQTSSKGSLIGFCCTQLKRRTPSRVLSSGPMDPESYSPVSSDVQVQGFRSRCFIGTQCRRFGKRPTQRLD